MIIHNGSDKTLNIVSTGCTPQTVSLAPGQEFTFAYAGPFSHAFTYLDGSTPAIYASRLNGFSALSGVNLGPMLWVRQPEERLY